MNDANIKMSDTNLAENSMTSSRTSVSVEGLSIKTPLGREIVNDLNLSILPKTKLAIIGMEGSGKSTIIKLLAGITLEGYQVKGNISLGNSGYLSQTIDEKWLELSPVEFLLREYSDNNFDPDDWNKLPQVMSALIEVNLDTKLIDENRPLSSLSGGELVRLQIAKILMKNPSILLLDEPTNHLDLRTIKWLEDYLIKTSRAVAFVSHDEVLIENVSNAILHLQYVSYKNKAIHMYSREGYAEFLERRERMASESSRVVDAERRQIKSLKKQYAEQSSKSNKKSSNASTEDMSTKNAASRGSQKSKERLADIREKIDTFQKSEEFILEENIKIDLPVECKLHKGKKVLDIGLPSLSTEQRVLATNIRLSIDGPEKIVIVGQNGVGKSTLLRFIHTQLLNDKSLKVGYLPQDYSEVLFDYDKPAIEYIDDVNKDKALSRTVLARLGFQTDEMSFEIRKLSGGQRAKLLIARMMLAGSNVLLLDEPTTNLSPLSNPVLLKVISEFPGAVIAVSHDRKFIKNTASRIYELTREGLAILNKEEIV